MRYGALHEHLESIIKIIMIIRVIVEKDGLYYQCLFLTETRIKCGKCLYGLINPFGVKKRDDFCKRCGATLCRTEYGHSLLTLRSYSP